MNNRDKTQALEQFTRDWWNRVVDNKEDLTPVDWLIVMGTMTGMLVDSCTETEEEAAECLGHFTGLVSAVAERFVNSAAVPPVH